MSVAALIPMGIILCMIVIIPLVIGVYVYRDARRRGMNAILWALAAAIAPALIGLIIYLLVRGNYSDLRCAQCGSFVTEAYVVCPRCAAKLRPACPSCNAPVEPGWKVCPRCATPLPDIQNDVQAPVRSKDRTGWKILAVVIAIPLLLIGLLLLGLSRSVFAGAASVQELDRDAYYERLDNAAYGDTAEKVQQWLDGLEQELGRAYALRYEHPGGSSTEYYFLVYVPGAGHSPRHSFGQSSSIFGTTLTLELAFTGNDGTLFNISSSADAAPNLKIVLDGKRIPCEIEVVDFNPTAYYIEPLQGEVQAGASDRFMPQRIPAIRE